MKRCTTLICLLTITVSTIIASQSEQSSRKLKLQPSPSSPRYCSANWKEAMRARIAKEQLLRQTKDVSQPVQKSQA